jgi:hypothetical protein
MIFEFKAPDGKLYEIQGPEGATPEQAFAMLQKHLGPKKPEPKSGLGLTPGSGLETAAVTAGSVGASFNEGLARSVDLIPQLGHFIRRQFNSDIPPLGKDPSGVRTGLKSLGIPVGTLEEQKKEYGVEEGPVRRIGGTAAQTIGEQAPFLAMGPMRQGLKATGILAGAETAGNEIAGEEGKAAAGLAALPLMLLRRGPKPVPTPTTKQVFSEAESMYDSSRQAGVIVGQPALKNIEQDIIADLGRQVYRPRLHPQTRIALKEMQSDIARGPATLEGVDSLRKVFKSAMDTASNEDRRLLRRMTARLDEAVGKLTPADLVQGNIAGVAELQRARSLWARAAKSERIEAVMKKAELAAGPNYAASGYEQALRREFKNLANRPSEMRLFSKAEQAAIRKVVFGGPVENVLRYLGKFSPKGVLTGVMHGASIASNPVLGIPLAGMTMAARAGATKLTERNARLAAELMRRGYPVPPNLQRFLDRGAFPAAAGATAGLLGQQ